MKALITGGAGFIGSHLVDRMLARGADVLVLDDFNDFYDPAVKRRNIAAAASSPRFRLVEGDIRDADAVDRAFASFRPDLIVHLAARAGVRPSLEQPILYQDVNLGGTQILLEAARKAKTTKFLFASSSSVYGDDAKPPFTEDDPAAHPVSPYAATKRAGELLGHAAWHLHGIAFWALRFFTVYGPRQRPEMAIHKFTRLIEEGEEIPQFGDGGSSRDYTYIDDILDALESAAQRVEGYEILNLGESRTITLRTLIALIEKELGKTARIRALPPQPGDVLATWADISRAGSRIGYSPRVPIEEGIRRFVAWYRKERRGR